MEPPSILELVGAISTLVREFVSPLLLLALGFVAVFLRKQSITSWALLFAGLILVHDLINTFILYSLPPGEVLFFFRLWWPGIFAGALLYEVFSTRRHAPLLHE